MLYPSNRLQTFSAPADFENSSPYQTQHFISKPFLKINMNCIILYCPVLSSIVMYIPIKHVMFQFYQDYAILKIFGEPTSSINLLITLTSYRGAFDPEKV